MPVPAGETSGSLCVWMHARGFRPQPRNGPGAIAEAMNGFDDGLICQGNSRVVRLSSVGGPTASDFFLDRLMNQDQPTITGQLQIALRPA